VGKSAHPKRKVNGTKDKIMNANHKRTIPEATGAPGNIPDPAWTLTQGGIHSCRGSLSVILALGLMACLDLSPTNRLTAQTFTTLYSFGGGSTNASGVYTNSDGANPYGGLTVAANSSTRYGTAANGGSSGYGTVFAINADGTGFTNLHSFSYSDGANPWAGLVLSGNTLYGTTDYGGSGGYGTVFAVNTDGTGFTILHTFTGGSDGAFPNGGLILSSNTLYGTAAHGGSSGAGTVFAVNADGTGFTNLHSFTATYLQRSYGYDEFGREYYVEMHINTDGAVPVAGLILAGTILYGTATGGGSGGNGTVFALNVDGTGFTTLHNFEQTYNLTQYPVGGWPPGGCFGGGCGAGSQCVGGFCGCSGFCIGGP
jgi:uncharacterized repeat protein (TIGR03803 family)